MATGPDSESRSPTTRHCSARPRSRRCFWQRWSPTGRASRSLEPVSLAGAEWRSADPQLPRPGEDAARAGGSFDFDVSSQKSEPRKRDASSGRRRIRHSPIVFRSVRTEFEIDFRERSASRREGARKNRLFDAKFVLRLLCPHWWLVISYSEFVRLPQWPYSGSGCTENPGGPAPATAAPHMTKLCKLQIVEPSLVHCHLISLIARSRCRIPCAPEPHLNPMTSSNTR